jgi:hypothetical protein
MSLRGCIWRREEVAVKPDCIVVITQNLPASNPTFTDSSFYHPSNIPLCAALLLSNPHSRSLRAAPRFSPTRFIPPVAPAVIIFELDCSHALGIKRYTFSVLEMPIFTRRRSLNCCAVSLAGSIALRLNLAHERDLR